jgi:hypothetical protein
MEQQAASSFWVQQSIPSRISEQGKASCIPALKIVMDVVSIDRPREQTIQDLQ